MKEIFINKMKLSATTFVLLILIFLTSFIMYTNEYRFLSNAFLENFFHLLGSYLALLIICSVFTANKNRLIFIVFSISMAIGILIYYAIFILLIVLASGKN